MQQCLLVLQELRAAQAETLAMKGDSELNLAKQATFTVRRVRAHICTVQHVCTKCTLLQ